MKLWKRDTEKWTVREVEGEPWPGYDSEGYKCYENTHFANEADAWKSLEAEARAWLSLATSGLIQARADVVKREKERADSAIAVATVIKTMPDNGHGADRSVALSPSASCVLVRRIGTVS